MKTPRAMSSPRMTAAPIISSSCCSLLPGVVVLGFCVPEPLSAFVDDALPGSVSEPQVDQCGDLLAMFGGDLCVDRLPGY